MLAASKTIRLGITVAIGILAAMATHGLIRAWQRPQVDAKFDVRARAVLAPLRLAMDSSLELLQSTAGLFAASREVERHEFATFVRPAIARHPEIQAIEWAPRVPRDAVRLFERTADATGFDGFRIFDHPASGPQPPPGERDRYPVWYVEPFEPNQRAFGFDLGSETGRRSTLELVRDEGRPAASVIVTLVQGERGFVAFAPVYGPASRPDTLAERRAALRGFIVGVFRLEQFLAAAMREARQAEVRLDVVDGPPRVAAPDGPQEILAVPGGNWHLRVAPAAHASWLPAAWLAWFGAAAVGGLVAFAAAFAARTARIAQLAGDLRTANAALAAEVQERAGAERALRQHTVLVSLALDTLHLVAWHLDIPAGKLTRASKDGPVVRDVPRGNARLDMLFGTIVEEDRQRIIEYARALATGRDTECQFEVRTRAEDGSLRRMAVVGRLERDAQGRPVTFTGLEADVTERRQAEEERRGLEAHLQNVQRLESLGVLAGGVAHDFNNLIMGIMGGVAVLQERLIHDPDTTRALALIDRGVTRAAELTRQLLDYAGRERADLGVVDLGELVGDLLPLLETSAAKRATLSLHVEPGTPPVEADATQLRQIAMNLIINAAEATSDGGMVTVRVGLRTATRTELKTAWGGEERAAGSFVFLSVTDRGCGMTPETRQRIFDPFFTTKFTGRGLGLAAVLGIVRAHRGALTVDTAPGRGSTFTVLLPPAPGRAATVPAAPPDPLRTPLGGTVLVVDDEAIARDVATEMLQAAGFDTRTAPDGHAALALLDGTGARFAAIVLDLTMPGLSGIDTHREIRRRLADVPILLVSGYSVHDARVALAESAWTAFLQKPYRSRDLLAALEQLLTIRRTPT